MKKIRIITLIGTVILGLFLSSCSEDFLTEKPRAKFTPVFFQSETGVRGGLTSLYAHLRFIYGYAYYFNACLTGTDEATWGQSDDGNFSPYDFTDQADLTSTTSGIVTVWNYGFPAINTASGIIENGEKVGIDASLLAEARVFRAFDYFLLVQTFGGVPLDLGAGNLAYNTKPIRTSVRNTVPEVYTIGIFPDLVQAIQDLPEQPRVTGAITKNVARWVLSKAYLTYAWWLENPNNIPTYPEAPRTDPDGQTSAWYFQQAYDIAMEAINNPGPYALQETYYDVNVGSNDRNSEIMFYADRTQESQQYNDANLEYATGGAADNFAVWMMTWNYTEIRSGIIDFNSDKNRLDTMFNYSTVQREAAQRYGRPWTRMAPPIEVFTETFADKVNDSRYDGTFTTVYRANFDKAEGDPPDPILNANYMQIQPGDAILTFLDEDPDPETPIDWVWADSSGVGGGALPGRSDWVRGPSNISRVSYPGLWKLGTYRTDNDGGYGQPNGSITRPFNIAKFSEFYFIAAEAAVKGASGAMSAVDLINVIRARAGKWKFDNGLFEEKVEDNSAAMVAATPASIDINYLLMERSREYFGEGYRWYDLVRTQKWEEIAGTYSICGPAKEDHTPELWEREILPEYYLRPIPQGQLDGMEMTDEEVDLYQNPGYRD